MLMEIHGELFNPDYIIHVGKAIDILRIFITTTERDGDENRCHLLIYQTESDFWNDYNKLKEYRIKNGCNIN